MSLLNSFALPAASLCRREIVRFYRFPSRVIGALGTPIVFWLLIGAGIGSSFQLPGESRAINYLEYFFPGSLLLILLFTSIFTMMSVIEDRKEGFLLSALASPASRGAIALGKVLGGALLAAAQGVVFLVLVPLVGIRMGLEAFLLAVLTIFLISVGLTGLGFLFAWRMDSTQGFHSIVNLFLVPLWLLSGALFPAEGAYAAVRWTMRLNPLTYANSALRHSLYYGAPVPSTLPSFSLSLGVTAVFAVVVLAAGFALAGRTPGGKLG